MTENKTGATAIATTTNRSIKKKTLNDIIHGITSGKIHDIQNRTASLIGLSQFQSTGIVSHAISLTEVDFRQYSRCCLFFFIVSFDSTIFNAFHCFPFIFNCDKQKKRKDEKKAIRRKEKKKN